MAAAGEAFLVAVDRAGWGPAWGLCAKRENETVPHRGWDDRNRGNRQQRGVLFSKGPYRRARSFRKGGREVVWRTAVHRNTFAKRSRTIAAWYREAPLGREATSWGCGGERRRLRRAFLYSS